ncbi:MAG: PQQ-binding-like beta-propeller repeat protein, partial [Planctomycetes bacterium]|nr:PQQ-binding-like beta-propeller repeat protein [Planctomycetota bacterium]
MTRVVLLLVAMFLLLPFAVVSHAEAGPIEIATTDWPWWRGPNRNGIAAAGQTPPTKWSATENILWKTRVPGRGLGSPIVVGNQVFLATADERRETQSVICFDRRTGRKMWTTEVHSKGAIKKGNKKASLASSTIACDGKRLFINFLNSGAIYTTALNRDGTQVWQTRITDYTVHQGYGSS